MPHIFKRATLGGLSPRALIMCFDVHLQLPRLDRQWLEIRLAGRIWPRGPRLFAPIIQDYHTQQRSPLTDHHQPTWPGYRLVSSPSSMSRAPGKESKSMVYRAATSSTFAAATTEDDRRGWQAIALLIPRCESSRLESMMTDWCISRHSQSSLTQQGHMLGLRSREPAVTPDWMVRPFQILLHICVHF